jgi:hypothetical protein
MTKFFIFLGIYLFSFQQLNAQEIVGIGARYDDTYREWDIYDDSEAVIGEFVQRWQQNNDWSEWDVRYGDVSGSIRQKNKNDISRWELRLDGETITIKTTFPNDPTQWIITDNNISLDFTTRYRNKPDEWQTNSKQFGKFQVNMYYENDPRDWEVLDDLEENVSPAIKLAMIFTTIMVSAPKK